jgi:hypothetical protein
MAGFFDGLTESIQNPLFLGGIGLMSGGSEGLQRGLMAGNQMQDQMRKRKSQEAMQNGLMAMQNLSDADKQILANSPELAAQALGHLYANKFDPMADIKRKTAEANYQQTLQENGMFPLKRQQIEAQIAQASRGGELPSNVREYEYFSKLLPDQQQRYLAVKRSQQTIDLGDRFGVPNQLQPGQLSGEVRKNLGAAEAEKVIGKAQGEGVIQLPKSEMALKQYEQQANIVEQDIDTALELSGKVGTTGFVGSGARYVPGTTAFDLKEKIGTIKANIGFDKLQNMRDNSPTGGALGQVAVQEMEALQSVYGSLVQSQSGPQLTANLKRFKEVQQQFRQMRREAYQRDVQRFGAANVPNPETGAASGTPGITHRWNPQTGRLEPVGGR